LNIVSKAWNIIEDYKGFINIHVDKEFMNIHVDKDPTISISSPSNWSPPLAPSFKLNIDASEPVENKRGVCEL